MPIIRRRLQASTVYPDDLRYNPDTDTVQSNVNGDWVDNPDADPRHQTTLPPRLSSNPGCDAAQSVVDALKAQISQILEAIDNASTLFTIAGIILSIFTFGAYALFISLALGIGDQMVGFGSTAIEAALTDPVYDTLKCILNCQMTNQGRLKAGGLAQVISDVNAQIGGIGAIIINAMLSLAGEGGINNLAALGTSTGDCDECGCGIDCGSTAQVTIGNVIEEYVDDGRRVLRVEAVLFSGSFYAVQIGNYGEAAGTYPCCHIFAWVKYSGAEIVTTGYTACAGGVSDPGNPETHDVSSAYWSSGIGGAPFVVNIVFGT